MGRPSLAIERREQLLAAAERAVLRHGFAEATITKIAEEADVQPSLVRHYLGNRSEVITAMIERALANVDEVRRSLREELPESGRLQAYLELLFGGELMAAGINQLVDALVVEAYFDSKTKSRLVAMYLGWRDDLEASIELCYPKASQTARCDVAHGLLELAQASATFGVLGVDDMNLARSRRMADVLVESLS